MDEVVLINIIIAHFMRNIPHPPGIRLPPSPRGNVVNLKKGPFVVLSVIYSLLAFSSALYPFEDRVRRCHEVTDEVFYSDCSVWRHNKSFSSKNLTFSL